MPLIRRRRIPLPLEHMPQMPSALRACDLRPLHPKSAVRVPGHGAGDAVEVGGPTAAGFKLVGSCVEGGVAGRASLRGTTEGSSAALFEGHSAAQWLGQTGDAA